MIPAPPAGSPIEVLVVDDSAVVRRFLSEVLEAEEDVVVSAVASNGLIALDRLEAHLPDVVILDIEMPVLDGLATLERIRPRWPDLPVVMFSTLTTRGATATLDALALGATDYVSKPSQIGDLTVARTVVAAQLLPVVRSCATVRRSRLLRASRLEAATAHIPTPVPAASGSGRPNRIDAVVIASSTGGPHALTEIIPSLPPDLPVPILVVQHMPALFTRLLAERLDKRSAIEVREGADGMPVEPGVVYIAPGGLHMVVRRARTGEVVLASDDGPPECSCRPAADVLFRSAAKLWGSGVTALVLTGMGHDGLGGSRAVRSAGGDVYVQDEASSVVWGMPGAIAKEGLAAGEIPLGDVAATLSQLIRRSLSEVPA